MQSLNKSTNPFQSFTSSPSFYSWISILDKPNNDDRVLTAASDGDIRAILLQRILFHFSYFLLKPNVKNFSKDCKEFGEISWNNLLVVQQITRWKLTQGNHATMTKTPETTGKSKCADGRVCMWMYSLFIYNKSSLLVWNPVFSHSESKYSKPAHSIPKMDCNKDVFPNSEIDSFYNPLQSTAYAVKCFGMSAF